MGILYKKDEGLKKQGNTTSTPKKVGQRKPSPKQDSPVFTKFTPSDITKHHQNTSEEKGHVKEYSEAGMSINTSTSEIISSLKWIEKRDQTSTTQQHLSKSYKPDQ